ncbi:glutamine-hydrolyzing GMP synthase [Candidatus Pacearchaeota archaeon]|nr:glutamine-hydrolyzing GMP synthase [Candidatus Pacearchaeota archaeon]
MSQILIVNVGGQYCHLIARRIRELGVQSRICTSETLENELAEVKGIIISGGPSSVYDPDSPVVPPSVFSAKIPILGICYGHQLLAHNLGGTVRPGKLREYGETSLTVIDNDSILCGIRKNEIVWMSHGDEVVKVPPGFQVIARTENCPIAAMSNTDQKYFGLQFHPEVSHTLCGSIVIKNFVFNICKCSKDWDMGGEILRLKADIQKQVGQRKVLFFVSGGVDSTVAFSLCAEALGPERVLGVFVDTGFMRKDEREEIEATFLAKGWHNIHYIDASKTFLEAVSGIADPEKKRKRIGNSFLDVQRSVMKQLGLGSSDWMLGQGTIYPDTIESGKAKFASLIKTHHNRVELIDNLIRQGLVLEPLKSLYKDEVRDIGRALGLPGDMVNKHPFPGPGLSVRCLCSEEETRPKSDHALSSIVSRYGLKAWRLPLFTVGVQGDYRSYRELVLLSEGVELPVYSMLASQIINKVAQTNRVVFILARKSPHLNIENAIIRPNRFLTMDRLDLLREADDLCRKFLEAADLSGEVWQFPVILLPLSLESGETIALRPILSSDAMTAKHAELPMDFLAELSRRLCEIKGIDLVLYDVTNKPPATIEWE